MRSFFSNGLVGGIKEAKVIGTGAQKYDLLMHFSIVCKTIDRNLEIWKLHLLLKRILNFVLSPEVLKDDLTEFEAECRLFNLQFSRLFTDRTPFKVHNIDHYSQATENFGCLFYFSTMRYERVHQLMKRFVHSSNNTSLPQQICYKWVVVNLIRQEQPADDDDDIFEIYEPNSVSYQNGDLSPTIINYIDQSRECMVLKTTRLNDVLIEQGEIYLYKRCDASPTNPLPVFVRIVAIVKQSQVKVLGKFIGCNKYFDRIQAFEVGNESDLQEIDKVEWYKPIKVIKTRNCLLIIKNFYIPYESESKYMDKSRTAFSDVSNQRYQIEIADNPSNYSDCDSEED